MQNSAYDDTCQYQDADDDQNNLFCAHCRFLFADRSLPQRAPIFEEEYSSENHTKNSHASFHRHPSQESGEDMQLSRRRAFTLFV
jgi:hypothetical protein